MVDKEINITYETLFDILRAEKKHQELQKLESSFYSDVLEYVQEKLAIISENQSSLDDFSQQEKKNIQMQLDNVKKILTEIYNRREKKIIRLAIQKADLNSIKVNTDSMLSNEIELFNSSYELFSQSRENSIVELFKQFKGKTTKKTEIKKKEPKKTKEKKSEKPNQQEQQEKKLQKPKIKTLEKTPLNNNSQETKKVKFLEDIPEFVGPELKTHGPFKKDQQIELPMEIHTVLLKQGKIQEI